MTTVGRAVLRPEATPAAQAKTSRKRTRKIAGALAAIALIAAAGWQLADPGKAAAAVTGKVAVFGDINNSSGGDTPIPVFGYVCTAVKNSGATVALSTGDALNDIADTSTSTALARWSKVMAIESPRLDAFMPVWRTSGDNDRLDASGRLAAWNQRFSNYPTSPDPSRRWYSKNLAGMHVVFMNTTYGGHMGWMGYVSETSTGNSNQAKWLVSDLKSYTAAHPGRSTIVVVTHYPLVNGKTTKPYAGSKKTEATALQKLFAKYGVDMVVTGDTHVYRRTMVTATKSGVTYRVPYIQIPPAASSPRVFGSSPIPSLGSTEAGWAPGSSYRGFITIGLDSTARTLALTVNKVAVSGGAVSSANDRKANGTALGGTFRDVPVGATR